MKFRFSVCLVLPVLLGACQAIGPVFVDYHGVRRDVATWINQQSLLSMQQKRSLAQLARAEQPLLRATPMAEADKLAVAKQRQIAIHCAQTHVAAPKIEQLQQQVFGEAQAQTMQRYQTEFPTVKLAASSIQCD